MIVLPHYDPEDSNCYSYRKYDILSDHGSNLLFIGPCLLARECLYKYPEESILDRIDDIPGRRLICVDHHGKRRQCTDEQLEAFKESRRQCTDEQMETFRQLS